MKVFNILFFFFISVIVFGQDNAITRDIKNAKNQGEKFIYVSDLLQQKKVQFDTKEFLRPDEVNIVSYNWKMIPLNNRSISINLPLGKKSVTIDLLEVPDSFYDFEVVTDKGERFSGYDSKAKHYRGSIRGEESSLAAISFFEDEVIGIVANDEGNYNIGNLKNSKNIVVYNDSNLKNQNSFECGNIDDDNFEGYKYDELFSNESINKQVTNKCVRLYFETEYDIYQNRGSVTAVRNYVTALFNQVSALYFNEDILVSISEVKVWTTNDPYTATNTSSLLSQFQSNISSFNGDLGQLLTYRSVGGGIAAGFAGLCNTNVDEKLSVSGSLTSLVTEVPTYSWNVMVITHEFGHLFGSRHTHACVWNGNNTAIDGCAGYVEGSCSLPSYPSGGGTMMSYCHLSGRPGINFNLGFGTQPGNLIRSRVANALCLNNCCVEEVMIVFPIESNNSLKASHQITASSVVYQNLDVQFVAPNILLKPGFSVSGYNTGNFRAIAGVCSIFSKDDSSFSDEVLEEIKPNESSPVLSPNPTSDFLNVTNIQDIQEWKIVDINGKTVESGKVNNSIQTKITINTSRLLPGVYYFNAVMKNGELFQKTVMKK